MEARRINAGNSALEYADLNTNAAPLYLLEEIGQFPLGPSSLDDQILSLVCSGNTDKETERLGEERTQKEMSSSHALTFFIFPFVSELTLSKV